MAIPSDSRQSDLIARAVGALRDLMDAAHRDRNGAPLDYEEFRLRYDEARRVADTLEALEASTDDAVRGRLGRLPRSLP